MTGLQQLPYSLCLAFTVDLTGLMQLGLFMLPIYQSQQIHQLVCVCL